MDDGRRRVSPAQLNFLAIYSPLLGAREEEERDQIVYFYSRAGHARQRRRKDDAEDDEGLRKLENEQLRQVGLARGMVNFARGFANDAPVDSVETEKHRIVLKELEQEWWVLASIDLTRLPSAKQTDASDATEYSSREVSPPALLLQQLTRAYRIFLLHHSYSLSDLYVRLPREKFCDTLERYWTPFALTWDVLLHGNPACEIYGGIKLAAGGELGVGVGEEEWGSGEREVLEGLIRNTEGLVDLTVSRFGEADGHANHQEEHSGNGLSVGPSDGMLFSGTGLLSRSSLRDVSKWLEDIYTYGENAYGVKTNPSSGRRTYRRPRQQKPVQDEIEAADDTEHVPRNSAVSESLHSIQPLNDAEQLSPKSKPVEDGYQAPKIPRPIATAANQDNDKATTTVDDTAGKANEDRHTPANTFGSSDVWMKYLTLGYGTAWGASKRVAQQEDTSDKVKHDKPSRGGNHSSANGDDKADTGSSTAQGEDLQHEFSKPPKAPQPSRIIRVSSPNGGRFIIGLRGDLNIDDEGDSRLTVRTIYATINEDTCAPSPSHMSTRTDPVTPSIDTRVTSSGSAGRRKLRTIVYGHAPFLYTLFFEPDCPLLTYPSFFHDLHHHLTPLHGPLHRSTAPSTIAASLRSSLPQAKATQKGISAPIQDLVYSPSNMTIRSSIPNIPAPGTAAAEGLLSPPHTNGTSPTWTRVEALSVHSRILETFTETRDNRSSLADRVKQSERERTLKTGKGWWIVWLRVATTTTASDEGRVKKNSSTTSIQSSRTQDEQEPAARDPIGDVYKEAILIRRSDEASSAGGRRTSTFSPTRHSGSATGWMQGMGSSAFSPLSRFAGNSSRSRQGSGFVAEADEGGTSTEDGEHVGGIGVDVRKYVEGLLSLNR